MVVGAQAHLCVAAFLFKTEPTDAFPCVVNGIVEGIAALERCNLARMS